VLSGFLIGGILLDHRGSPRLMRSFYIRRAARILPLAFLSIAVGFGMHGTGLVPGHPWPLAVYVLFAANFWMAAAGNWGVTALSALWSLAIEEQFYLVAPWVVRTARPRRLPWIFLATAAAAPLARWVILAIWPDRAFAASLLPFCRTDGLGLGLLGAWIVRDAPAVAWCRAHLAWLRILLGLSGVGCAFLTKVGADNASFAMAAGGYTIVAVFYSALLLLADFSRGSLLTRALSLAPLVLLGRYSYFIYLFHGWIVGLIVSLLFRHQWGLAPAVDVPQLAVGLAGLFVVASLSWRWFEEPLLTATRKHTGY